MSLGSTLCQAHRRYRRKPCLQNLSVNLVANLVSKIARGVVHDLSCRLGCAGVIVDNAPAFRKSLPDQREDATYVAFGTREMPVAQNQGGIRSQKTELHRGKVQLAH